MQKEIDIHTYLGRLAAGTLFYTEKFYAINAETIS